MKPGEKLGPYEIVAPIGAGGMGEVYRARDTRLGRDVAIKISAEQFSERFEREARAIAALNHPNICHLYDVGPNYLVMELVEGETLKGPLPLDDSLQIAAQIADALEAAHERGIIHRDLKPANIKITPDGTVKVLDFGLAKATETPQADPASSPTITMSPTRAGMILGTAAYMAPEQARGKAVDKRADIWAFGCVLYEMLTGERLFRGETITDILAAVVKEQPDLSRIPARFRPVLQKCLEKDPRQRLRDIGDWKLLIESAPPVKSARISVLPWATAAALAIALGMVVWRASRPTDRPLVRLDVDLGPDVALPANQPVNLALSPDGARLVYGSGNPPRLYSRRLDQPKANGLPGTDGALGPSFTPDGQWVIFWAHGKLNKISVEGGAVVPLAGLPNMAGVSWDADGYMIAGGLKGLLRIPTSGGSPATVLETAPGDLFYAYPEVLPGGKAVLFADFRAPSADSASIEVFSFGDRRRKTLVRGGINPHYLPSGHLVYTTKGTLFAVLFDLDRLETRGPAVPVLDDLATDPVQGLTDVSFSSGGTAVYRKAGWTASTGMMTILWQDASGKKEALRAKPAAYAGIWLSPDGKRTSFTIAEGGNQDVWVYDPPRDAMTKLTFGGFYYQPLWSPNGRYLVFSGLSGIYWTRADGTGQPQQLIQSGGNAYAWSFTPDGRRLAYYDASSGHAQIWTVPVEEQGAQLKAGKPEQFMKSQSDDGSPSFSPDGHWLAYQSSQSGKLEVYVRAFPPPASGQGGQWQISNSGGWAPYWSRAGHELLYQQGDRLMAVSYSVQGDSFVAEKPRVRIEKLAGTDLDLAPDGKRIIVLAPAAAPEAANPEHEVTFLFNFLDELRRRIPGGK